MKQKIVFAGCSFTAGNGWVNTTPEESYQIEDKDNENLWVNLCHQRIKKFKSMELINLGKGGASNTDIYTNIVRAISTNGNTINTIICQWTSMPRYNWNAGFELWNTSANFSHPKDKQSRQDINLNNGQTWSKNYINDLTDRLLVMHHLHWEILKVVDYSNIISELSKKTRHSSCVLCKWIVSMGQKLFCTT